MGFEKPTPRDIGATATITTTNGHAECESTSPAEPTMRQVPTPQAFHQDAIESGRPRGVARPTGGGRARARACDGEGTSRPAVGEQREEEAAERY